MQKTHICSWFFSLEVVSKPQIRFKGKAQADRESAVRLRRMSIYRRSATQPLDLRWGFETTSKHIGGGQRKAFLIKKLTVAQRHIELSTT